ncbi:unnamed protein product [Aspergillus oryzae]|nr:unnamed protein product [Aspergillus oryzae]
MRALSLASVIGIASAACPYMTGELERRDTGTDDATAATEEFLSQYYMADNDTFLTSDVGGPIEDQNSLQVGDRGPTLLEDFIFRQKIQRFDHERVWEDYMIWNVNGIWLISGNRFLNVQSTLAVLVPMVSSPRTVTTLTSLLPRSLELRARRLRFSCDSRLSRDAILFPDLIHAVKPRGDNEIPQAATAHDSAWDFFSQQPSSLHTLLWAMSGHGIPRSLRHVDGFGIHTFRFVTDNGDSKLVKFHWKSLQGKASMVWEEAQQLGVQIMDEEDQLKFGFDLFDPTKIVPEEYVPITKLGKMTLNRNPRNYFAETEQVMFQPGHIVRGVDFTEDPLLQGRLFSYLDTQLNRHGGPNFEQLPINQPRVPVHNNNRDGAGQMFIPLNPNAYSPNTLNKGSPKQANQTVGKGFFTAPGRESTGRFTRAVSPSFEDVWSQPRLFYNSLTPAEQQFVVDAIRFENSNVKSSVVRNNVIIQLNRVSNDLARRVARAIGVEEPEADPTYYHNNKTTDVGTFGQKLKKLDGLKVGFLASVETPASIEAASELSKQLSEDGVDVVVVAERLSDGVDQTYSGSDAIQFDAVIVAPGAEGLFSTFSFTAPSNATSSSTLFPAGRPLQIVIDGFRFGKPVGAVGSAATALKNAGIQTSRDGVYVDKSVTSGFVDGIKDGLRTFKFLDRFKLDH